MNEENELTFEQEMKAAYDDEGGSESPKETGGEETPTPKTDPEAVSGAKTDEAEQADQQEEAAAENKGQGQSHEENARFKAMRLKAEEDAWKKMQAALAREVDNFYRQQYAGKTNPDTGAQILTKADAEAYESAVAKAGQAEQADVLRKELLDLGMSEQAAAALVKPLTSGRDDQAQKQAADAHREAELAEFSRKIDGEIEELNRRHPECGIKGPGDIGSDAALLQEIGQRADKNLVKAWESLHYEELIERERAAARQSAINQARGGSHVKLPASANGGGRDVSISKDELAVWKRMGFTEEDAVKHYLGK